jgi:hypothetical protein
MNLDTLESQEGTTPVIDIANQGCQYAIPKNLGSHPIPRNLGLKLIPDLPPKILF